MNERDSIIARMSPSEVMGYVTLGGRVSRRQLAAATAALDAQMDAAMAKRHAREAASAALAARIQFHPPAVIVAAKKSVKTVRPFTPRVRVVAATKRCARCGSDKPATLFYRDNRRSGGLTTNCRKCTNEITEAARYRHKRILSGV